MATFFKRKKLARLSGLMPPVGQNRTSASGPPSACNMARPPACAAGNSFIKVKPWSRAVMTSLGVITPGTKGSLAARTVSTSAGVQPGERAKRAPASITRCTSTACVTVPAPRCMAGTLRATASMQARPCGVRSVISITSMPPASKASANGTAWATSVRAITGTTRDWKAGRAGMGVKVVSMIRTAGVGLE